MCRKRFFSSQNETEVSLASSLLLVTFHHLPPKFISSSDFGHYILKLLENENFIRVGKKMGPTYLPTEISSILGETSPADFSSARDSFPRPPAFDAHASWKKNKTIGSSRILYRNIVIRIHLRLTVKRLC